MKHFKITSAIVTLLLSASIPLHAQEKKRVSPHETVSAMIDGAKISIVYGRPFTKDPKTGEKRKIWGGLVPFEKSWRLGADEATLLTTDHDLDLGGTKIPTGSYSLYLVPAEGSASLVVNKQTGQWGTKHDESQDFAKIEMKKEAMTSALDQFTITLDKNREGQGGTMRLKWENAIYSVLLKVGNS
ncbi:MAG: DUF2911 domain-containing protein [Chthoniobacterales bacterium]|nr:DUF2911 domain-containing protein [Chthoniobacterales bacterium]